jgi:hypothetical protein
MGYIKEPLDVDLVVVPMPLSEEDKAMIHNLIANYKRTRKIPRKSKKQTEVSAGA